MRLHSVYRQMSSHFPSFSPIGELPFLELGDGATLYDQELIDYIAEGSHTSINKFSEDGTVFGHHVAFANVLESELRPATVFPWSMPKLLT